MVNEHPGGGCEGGRLLCVEAKATVARRSFSEGGRSQRESATENERVSVSLCSLWLFVFCELVLALWTPSRQKDSEVQGHWRSARTSAASTRF